MTSLTSPEQVALTNQLTQIENALKNGNLVNDRLQVVQKNGFKWVWLKIINSLAGAFKRIFCLRDPWIHYRINNVAQALFNLCENKKTLLEPNHDDLIENIFDQLREKAKRSHANPAYLEAVKKYGHNHFMSKLCIIPMPPVGGTKTPSPISGTTVAALFSSATPGELQQVRNAIATFGHKLHEKLVQDPKYVDKSFAISPVSIISVLGLVLNAIPAGEKQQFIDNLGLKGMAENRVHAALSQALKDLMIPAGGEGHIGIAQGIAMSKNGNPDLAPAYKNLVQNLYDAEIFRSGNVKNDVNAWVDRKTNYKIPTLLDNEINEGVVLLNAVDLVLKWQDKFKKASSSRGNFTFANGQCAPVTMMNQEKSTFAVYRGKVEGKAHDFDMMEMNYISPKGRDLKQVVFLPNNPADLERLEMEWTPEVIKECREVAKQALDTRKKTGKNLKVEVSLPKIHAKSDLSIKDILQTMGLIPHIDTSVIKLKDAAITDVLHRTMVENDEEGTKAAAVTGMVMRCMSMPPPQERFHFNANHNYAYFIMDGDTVIFRGRVKSADPLVLDK